MKALKSTGFLKSIESLRNVKITQKLTGLLVGLIIGFIIIGLAYLQVLKAERESVAVSEKMSSFENGIHEVQLDLLNARQSETEFYLKKYPIFLGKFDTRIIVASQNLSELTTMVKSEKRLGVVTELGDAFEVYRENFIKAAEYQIEIGLDANTGLNVVLGSTLKQIEEELRKLNSPVLDRSLLKIRQYSDDFSRYEDTKYKNSLLAEVDKFTDYLNKSKFPNNSKKLINLLLTKYVSSFDQMANYVNLLVEQKKQVKQSVKSINPLFKKLISISSDIIKETRQSAEITRNRITTFFLSTLSIIALAFSIGLWLLARSITKPMKILQNTVVRVNDGDLTARARLDRHDELGELATAFDQLLDERVSAMVKSEKESEQLNESVIDLIRAVSQLAQNKDLAVKIPVSENITGAISDSLNLLAKETAKIMREVQTTSSQVADVSLQVKQQSDTVISVASKERQEVESTAKMLENSVKAMNDIALDSDEANTKAENTMRNTQQALDSVLSSVEGIKSIRSTISETEKRIKRLGERSQEISGIVSLINSIAERTHILALNASMHAASAGEAGRGFAVVADEVQRLAENAREATSEISTVVNNIRVETADTVAIMNTVISQVAEGTQLANQAGQSMMLTQQATSDLVNSVKHIAKSSEIQKNLSKQLLQRANKIKESTEQTGRELLEQTKSTDKLARYSEDLVTIVSVFKLPQVPVDNQQDVNMLNTQDIKQAV